MFRYKNNGFELLYKKDTSHKKQLERRSTSKGIKVFEKHCPRFWDQPETAMDKKIDLKNSSFSVLI